MTTYYVRQSTGNDEANDGRSTGSPWQNLDVAVNRLKPGDTLKVMGLSTNDQDTYQQLVSVTVSGTATDGITIENHTGHDPIVDGLARYKKDGIAVGGDYKQAPAEYGYMRGYEGGLFDIRGSYVTVKGLTIQGSMGKGLRIFPLSGKKVSNVTVQDCTIKYARRHGLLIHADGRGDTTNVTIDGCVVSESGSYYPGYRQSNRVVDHSAAIVFKSGETCTFKNGLSHNNWGEALICDANNGESRKVTIEDSIFYDNYKGVYIQASDNVVFQRNLVFSSERDGGDSVFRQAYGINVNTGEHEGWGDTTDITVVNNIFAGFGPKGSAISVTGGPGRSGAMVDCIFDNNTVVNCDKGVDIRPVTRSGCKFYNNIIHDCGTDISANNYNGGAGWSFDYNHPDASAGVFVGGNDVYGNPTLEDASYVLPKSTRTSINHFWITPLNTTSSRLSIGHKYRILNASNAKNAGTDRTADWIAGTDPDADRNDYFATNRGGFGAWDMGAHEYTGTAPAVVNATLTPNTASGSAPLTVTYTGSASGGSAPYTFKFDYDYTSNTATATGATSATGAYTYDVPGKYFPSLLVTDAANQTATDTTTVKVFTNPPTAPDVKVELDLFNAGATSIALNNWPKAMFIMGCGATANGSAQDDSQMTFGIVDGGNLEQYALGSNADNAMLTTDAGNKYVDGKCLWFANANGAKVASAEVTARSASAWTLSWDGSNSGEKCMAWSFYGQSLKNASVPTVTLNGHDDTATVAGDWNFIIMPYTGKNMGVAYGGARFSLGFAEKNGKQHCVAYHNRNNQDASDVRSKMYSDRIAASVFSGEEIVISNWDAAGVQFKLKDSGGVVTDGLTMPFLAMNIQNAGIHIDIENTPTATGTAGQKDYTSSQFNPQIIGAILTNLPNKNTVETGANAGVFQVYGLESGGTDKVIGIASKDNTSTSIEKSYAANNFILLDEDAAVIEDGTGTQIANGWRLNLTTADTTPRKMLAVTIENTTAPGAGPVAKFEIADTDVDYGETATFRDLSTGDGVNAITGWVWDFGDGSTASATTGADQTHTYNDQGFYTVTLTVTDATAATATATAEYYIGIPEPTAAASVTPASGTTPLTLTLDATACDPGGNESIARYLWSLENLDGPSYLTRWGEVAYTDFMTVDTTASTASAILENPGHWRWQLVITQAGTNEFDIVGSEEGAEINAYEDPALDFANDDGTVHVVGPYTATFRGFTKHGGADGNWTWVYGDGSTASSANATATHTYATATATQNYTVTASVSSNDGVTDSASKANYINVYPTPVRPATIPAMSAELTAILNTLIPKIEEHAGEMDGSWATQAPPNANVYAMGLTRAWANGYSITVYEDEDAMSSQTSIANCQANPGSFYDTFSASTLSLYVHPTNSDNPGTNSEVYRFIAT